MKTTAALSAHKAQRRLTWARLALLCLGGWIGEKTALNADRDPCAHSEVYA